MMNLGSHTPAQLIKLLPELGEKYQKAQNELTVAQQNLHDAKVRAEDAKRVLVEVLRRYIRGYPSDIVTLACQPIEEGVADLGAENECPTPENP